MSKQPIVLVFGGSGGIGSCIADRFLQQNVELILPTRSDCDLSSSSSIETYLTSLTQTPDVVIHAAGVNQPRDLNILTPEIWHLVFQINFFAPLQIMSHLAELQAKKGGGNHIIISSLYAEKSRAGRAAYSASKAALESAVRSFTLEYGARKVKFGIVQPGFIETSMTRQNNSQSKIDEIVSRIPLGRLGSGHDIANLVAFMASVDSEYLNGVTIKIDGGYSVAG
jgi:3-oxoacyl-[acyl-carrier protein] reductase